MTALAWSARVMASVPTSPSAPRFTLVAPRIDDAARLLIWFVRRKLTPNLPAVPNFRQALQTAFPSPGIQCPDVPLHAVLSVG